MSKDHVAGLAIQIPEDMLRQVILQEVAAALPDREKIVESVVRAAMAEKERSYSKETIFEAEIKKEIRKLCTEVFREWLEGKKAEIRETLLRELEKNKGRKLKQLVDHLAAGFSKVWIGRINLEFSGDDD